MFDDEMLEKLTPQEMIDYLDRMIVSYENLPYEALYAPVTHNDFASFLRLMSGVLRALCSEDN